MPLLMDYPEASAEQELLIPVQVKGEERWRHIPASKLSGGTMSSWYETSLEEPIALSFNIE